MRKIDESRNNEKYTLLVPAMLDCHFPLMKYAFYSKMYHPVILDNEDGIVATGLKYVNNDMCYPCILNTGQMIDALQSGKFDVNRTHLLMATAGDACRGANYTSIIKRAIKSAGFDNVRVISLNVRGLDKENQFSIGLRMAWRALFSMFYGDILMALRNQVRPYEKVTGATDKLWGNWIEILSEDLKKWKHLSIRSMVKNFEKITKDFYELEKIDVKKERIGIVGEIYIKYCHLGNWDMIKFIEEQGGESHTNGVSWYAMYYMDTHMSSGNIFEKFIYSLGMKFIGGLQQKMINALRKYDFYTLEDFGTLKKEAQGYVNSNDSIGDGWLIGAEVVGHVLHDCEKVVACQPFGCMPNHVCGRGLYPSIQRKIPNAKLVSVDTDSSGSKLNVYNRVAVLLTNGNKKQIDQ